MATLTVWRFPTAEGAEEAQRAVRALQAQQLVVVHDAAVVSWSRDARRPRTRLHGRAGGGSGGAFWRSVLRVAVIGSLRRRASGAGSVHAEAPAGTGVIDGRLVANVQAEMEPGSSALLLSTSDAVLDRVRDVFVGSTAQLVASSLTHDQERTLLQALDSDPVVAPIHPPEAPPRRPDDSPPACDAGERGPA